MGLRRLLMGMLTGTLAWTLTTSPVAAAPPDGKGGNKPPAEEPAPPPDPLPMSCSAAASPESRNSECRISFLLPEQRSIRLVASVATDFSGELRLLFDGIVSVSGDYASGELMTGTREVTVLASAGRHSVVARSPALHAPMPVVGLAPRTVGADVPCAGRSVPYWLVVTPCRVERTVPVPYAVPATTSMPVATLGTGGFAVTVA